MTIENRFEGVGVIHDPQAALELERAEDGIRSRLQGFADGLPPGLMQVVFTAPHAQKDPRSCFYAGLIGLSEGIHSDRMPPDEIAVVSASERTGLIDGHGAETIDPAARARQVGFVRQHVGLNIRFPERRTMDRADEITALTTGMMESGNPVLFGLVRHWVVLDGFKKEEDGSFFWTGMNPARGLRTLISMETVKQRMTARAGTMDVITVENPGPIAFTAGSIARANGGRSRSRRRVVITGNQGEPRMSGKKVSRELRFRGQNRFRASKNTRHLGPPRD